MNDTSIGDLMRLKIKDNKDSKQNNCLNLNKFKIIKFRNTRAEYKKKIDDILKNLLIDSYKSKTQKKQYLCNDSNIYYYLKIKKHIKPTPFQIYEKIKSKRIIKLKRNENNNYKFNQFYLSPVNKTSNYPNNNKFEMPQTKKNIYKKINVLRRINYFTPTKEKISNISNSRINSFTNKRMPNDDSGDNFYPKLFIKNEIIKNFKKDNENKYLTKIGFYKNGKNKFLIERNLSLYNNIKNLPKINKSVSQLNFDKLRMENKKTSSSSQFNLY
jgi:hypothetical protein